MKTASLKLVTMAASAGLFALPMLASAGFCDTKAKSERDCLECKVGAGQNNQTICEEETKGPCFWVETGDSPYPSDYCDGDGGNGGTDDGGGGNNGRNGGRGPKFLRHM